MLSEQADLVHYNQYQQDSKGFQTYLQDFSRDRERIKCHIEQYEEDRVHFEKAEEYRDKEKFISVLQWISGAQSDQDHEAKCSTRESCPGSGDWILKHPKIQNWKKAQVPTLSTAWLNGKPGAGTA